MKAVIYARFSSEKQNEASIEGQLRECLQYAEYNNIQVIGNYIDRAQSAKNRPPPRISAHDKRQLQTRVRVHYSVEIRPFCAQPLRQRILQKRSQKERRSRHFDKGDYITGRGRHFA